MATAQIPDSIAEISRKSPARARLLRAAGRILSDDEAEDALQDGIVQVLSSSAQFRGEALPSTWMYRVVINAALMRRRKAKNASRVSMAAAPAGAVGWAAGGEARPLPDRVCESREELARAGRALADMPEDYRAALERCLLEERDTDEVARELGITPGCLRTRTARARRRIESALAAA